MLSLLHIVLLPAALLLDTLCGEPPVAVHPVCWMGRWAQRMESFWRQRLLAHETPTPQRTFVAGSCAALSVVLPFVLGCWFILCALTAFAPWLAWCAGVAVVAVCLAPRSLAEHALRVAEPLERYECRIMHTDNRPDTKLSSDPAHAQSDPAQEALEEARTAVSMVVGRNTETLDAHGIARACIESVSENLTDGVLATIFWAVCGLSLGGVPEAAALAVLHRTSNVLDALWGKRNTRYQHFGTWAARTDDLLNALPARLALPCIALAASFHTPDTRRSVRSLLTTLTTVLREGWRFRTAHASPNSAWSEAPFAAALGLRLGGAVRYGDLYADYPYIGTGTPKATAQDIRHAVRLMKHTTWLAAFMATLVVISVIA